MKSAVILAAGSGNKLWPYTTIRPKAMIPIGTRPLISYTVESLLSNGIEKIYVAANHMSSQIQRTFLGNNQVVVIDVGPSDGSAKTLLYLSETIRDNQFLLLYGDILYHPETIKYFIQSAMSNGTAVLAVKPGQNSIEGGICLNIDAAGRLSDICGQPRSGYEYKFGGFILTQDIFKYIKANPGYFDEVQVGMMSPLEHFLELSVYDLSKNSPVYALTCKGSNAIDIDYPWDILYVNYEFTRRECSQMTDNCIASSAFIDKSAHIEGYIYLGENSKIGPNVIIRGNCIVGDNTIIENGAILLGDNIVGSNSYIANYCYIDKNTVIGNNCRVDHCAEISGVIFDGVCLTHYMELYGIIGERTDIGAATVCGSLRFDDGDSTYIIGGKRIRPKLYPNATYIGDFCRTGVNVIIFPGKRIGCYSIIGAGTILDRDVPNNTLIYPKQELVEKEWGPSRYGW